MKRLLSSSILAIGLGIGVMGCGSDNSGAAAGQSPSGTPAQTPEGNMQGPAHSNGTEGADTAQNQVPVAQSPGAAGTVDPQTPNQGRLPTTQPQP
jgi:hypothetical protein